MRTELADLGLARKVLPPLALKNQAGVEVRKVSVEQVRKRTLGSRWA